MSVTQDGEHDPVHTKKHVHESQSCYVKRSALLINSGTFQKVRNSNQYWKQNRKNSEREGYVQFCNLLAFLQTIITVEPKRTLFHTLLLVKIQPFCAIRAHVWQFSASSTRCLTFNTDLARARHWNRRTCLIALLVESKKIDVSVILLCTITRQTVSCRCASKTRRLTHHTKTLHCVKIGTRWARAITL